MQYACSVRRMLCLFFLFALNARAAQPKPEESDKSTHEHYTKEEYRVPVRDGVHLYTVVYSPKNHTEKLPILLMRTPYSAGPYGQERFRPAVGPSALFSQGNYIVAYQDVRGCFLSEGTFVDMRPHIDHKTSARDIDESSDTYDTVDWLVKNLPNNNGRVGLWGISYPGFYSSAGMIDAHPALKAVSPQAPIADWFFDDFHHHGAFFMPHAFNFLANFGQARPEPTALSGNRFEHGTPDGYQFFLDMGSLKNANKRYFRDRIAFWNRLIEHPNYDDFWKGRNLLPHLNHVAPAVMTVGGWFDAEDLYGALNTYRAVEAQNPGIFNVLVMGPWRHGGWSRTDGDRLGDVHFGAKTSLWFRKDLELAFFDRFLKDRQGPHIAEASVFETGANRWRTFDRWPPANLLKKKLYLRAGGQLAFDSPADNGTDEYVSDPARPVPFTEAIAIGMTPEYMTDDQRFASRRPDVLSYQTDVLKDDVTLAGPLLADLRVATSGTDADWVVKLIDVLPGDAKDPKDLRVEEHMGGYQMMVRSEVIRGRFRNSYEHPEPFKPGEPAAVRLPLQDVLHTFQRGHRIMVQVQSTWFPLVDRNPQRYVDNIFLAEDKDFTRATERVFRSKEQPSGLEFGVLPAE
jgi:putative CocE/NonD family hydrolase